MGQEYSDLLTEIVALLLFRSPSSISPEILFQSPAEF